MSVALRIQSFTLQTYGELLRVSNLEVILRTVAMAAAVGVLMVSACSSCRRPPAELTDAAYREAVAASYAVRAAKEAIDQGLEVDLATGLEIEQIRFAAVFGTEDARAGMASFVENGPGKAVFKGR